jgi:hypothetical protein
MGRGTLIMAALLLSALAGCQRELPDRESAGYRLYALKCGVCHAPQHPRLLPAAAWEATVHRMEIKVKNSGVREPLTEEETRVILGYLKGHSRERQF